MIQVLIATRANYSKGLIAALLATLGVVLLLGSPVEAASFNCAKAQTSIEHAICDNPALSAADEEMAAAYKQMHQGLTEEEFKLVRQDQRDWLRYVARYCTDDAEPLKGRYDEAGSLCLKDQFVWRTEVLQPITNAQGYRFYRTGGYEVALDINEDFAGNHPVGSVVFSSLRLAGSGELARYFNMHIATRHARPDSLIAFEGGGDEIHTASILSISSRLISIEIADWGYNHGAAHGYGSVFYDHFLTKEKRPLAASDIFDNAQWLPLLDAIVVAQLREGEFDEYIWEDLTSVDDTLADPQNWRFDAGGLTIQFQTYGIGPYVIGAPTVTVGWDEIEHLLAAGAHGIVSGS